jgi:lysophospholipase L1-like esterase
MIVFYAGDNDLAQNRTPEQVAVDFKAYVAKVRTKLPETPILFLAIKPSIARWKIYEKQQKANAAVREYCSQSPSLRFVDIVPATLGPDGQPNKEFFLKDGLHLNEAGYAAWAKVLSGEIAKAKR